MKPPTIRIAMSPEELFRRHEARNKRVLYRQGGYVRTAMQRSMRYTSKSDKHSQPGQPPLAHKNTKRGPLLRKLVTFFVNERDGSVAIGPEATGAPRSPTIPQALDKGGDVRVGKRELGKTQFDIGDYGPIRYAGGGKFRRTLLETPAQTDRATRLTLEENAVRTGSATIHIKPRPFTAPVLTDGGDNLRKLVAREPL